MKNIYTMLLVFFISSCGKNQERKSVSDLSTFTDSTSYALGADLGENLKRQQIEIDYDIFMAGLMDGMETEMVKFDQKQRRAIMASLQKNIRDKAKLEGDTNLKIAEEFLDTNKKNNNEIKETPTGLQYKVLKEGTGVSPNSTDKVRVHYVGKLLDGSVFDSSVERGEPSEFGLNQVIKGWTEGLQLMKVGGKYEFFIHPKIAYGSRPRPNIPANSLLIFEVELLDILTKK
tara:strand:+ start:400 stop:1092 length:693 start_codon:yes stop_codon:yes gene_type:complete